MGAVQHHAFLSNQDDTTVEITILRTIYLLGHSHWVFRREI